MRTPILESDYEEWRKLLPEKRPLFDDFHAAQCLKRKKPEEDADEVKRNAREAALKYIETW